MIYSEERNVKGHVLRPGSPTTAYFAHLDNISKNMTIDDMSRVDAMIVLRMRVNGHSWKVMTDTINLCVPVTCEYPSNSNWQGTLNGQLITLLEWPRIKIWPRISGLYLFVVRLKGLTSGR